jgi:hypothetical protein
VFGARCTFCVNSDDVETVDVSMELSVNAMATDTQEESMADITDEIASTGNLPSMIRWI